MKKLSGCFLLPGLLALAGCGGAETAEKDLRREIAAEVRRVLGATRPIEPRLSLDTGWAPCCTSAPTPATPGFRELLRLFQQRSKQTLPAASTFFFKTDEAVTRKVIADLEPAGSPEDRSDLSAAYLQLASLAGRPELLIASLEASAEALALRPGDPPALFNRALALTQLHLETTAAGAWQEYLDHAPNDGWAGEARDFKRRCQSPSYAEKWQAEIEPVLRHAAFAEDLPALRENIGQHRQRSREWAENGLLSAWAAGKEPSASASLQAAARVGAVQAERGGDRMLADGAGSIAAAEPADLVRLRAGHRELMAGITELYGRWRLSEARAHFRQARENLSRSPYALWADLYLSLIAYYQEDFAGASKSLEVLKSRFDSARYPVLAGRRLWIEGLIAASTNRLEDAAARYREAIRIFEALGEDENLAAVHALRGEALSKLGHAEESWAELAQALAKVDRIFDPIRHHAVLEAAILDARRQGSSAAGLAFAEEHLRVARRTGSPQILHYALMHRASLRYVLGNLEGAQADLAAASRAVESLEDPSLRRRSAADFELVSAEMLVGSAPKRALSLLSRTIAQYERTQYAYLLPQAYGARAHAFRNLGDLAAAEEDLARQIGVYEASVGETRKDVFRLSLLDQAGPAFDEMIALQATALVRPEAALEYSERSRFRSFRDTLATASPQRITPPLPWARFDPDSLRAKLPLDLAILEYSLLEDRLLTWVITRSGIVMLQTIVQRKEVAQEIKDLSRRLDRERAPAVSHSLYDLLVRPALPHLQGKSHLVVVPDKELFLVPFDALVDRKTEKFLIEDWTLSFAPSASLYGYLHERLERRPHGAAPDLVIAATGAPGDGYRYRSLPQAPQEARAVTALYPQGELLQGPSKESFLSALSRARVFHFAGHAVPSGDQPFVSRLVLTDTPEKEEELHAWELYDRSFPYLDLVVLSACGTAESTRPRLGLAATLAGPFLAAGVPEIVGSQWPVNDDVARPLLIAFHRRFAQGADAATALRATKLEFLHSPNPGLASPRVWATFILVGG